MPAYAASTSSQSGIITVTGIVPPAKYVYIDDSQTIKQVVSNTTADAEPIFITDSAPPERLSPTPKLLQDYQALKAKYNFAHQGVVYDSQIRPMTAVGLQSALSLTQVSSSAVLTVSSARPDSLLSLVY